MNLTKEICKELGVPQYVKLPIPAYAIELIPENKHLFEHEERLDFDNKTIDTLEGRRFEFEEGDYMIIGNSNEVWTIKRDIFHATYKPVD